MTRTPLTYYGGKQRLAAQIASLMPPHRVYLEPFAGGAAVLFAKPQAERETLNDLDGTIVRFWRALRDRPDELAAAVAATPYSRDEWRASGEPAGDDVEAARRLLVQVDQSFSRSRRSWSVPCIGDGRGRWQPGSWENLPPKLLAAATRLQGVALEHGDALDLIPKWDRDDAVIYVDPPYAGPHRADPAKGYRVDDDDGTLWARLLPVLRSVRDAAVILSGYPCAETDALAWRAVPLHARRTVQARDGGTLPVVPETVWLSPRVPDVMTLDLAGSAA